MDDAASSSGTGEAQAHEDAHEGASRRSSFSIPTGPGGTPVAYFAGHSLGLRPHGAVAAVEQRLAEWAQLGVDGHHGGWMDVHDGLRGPAARLVGASPGEIVHMNTLTVNLHVLLASFYRPTRDRYRIVIEDSAFPSDSHVVRTQAAWHGLDPDEAVVRLRPSSGRDLFDADEIGAAVSADPSIALVLLGGVNYLTGQLLDIPQITAAAREAGAIVVWDLAHAAGNVPLDLHGWGVDAAAWCTYKYLNSGPGAIAGAFVHERHTAGVEPARLGGWWGVGLDTRFLMAPEFRPARGAEGFQLSNPPLLSLAPVAASLALFDEVGMPALRARSIALTGFLESLVETIDGVGIVTPRDREARGAQLSLRIDGSAADVQRALARQGVVADFREPDIIRLAPAPLYTSFDDCRRAASALARQLA